MTVNKEEFDNESRDPNTYGWVVDTERGISRAALINYEGSCEEDAELIKCERELNNDRGFTSIVVIKSRRQFVEVTITVDTSTGGSTSGTCTKI